MRIFIAIAFILVCRGAYCTAAEGDILSREKASSHGKTVYAEYAHGMSFVSMDNLNTYYIDAYARQKDYFHSNLNAAQAIDAEIGMFVLPNLKLGISYVFLKGSIEDNMAIYFVDIVDSAQYEYGSEFRYLDALFRSIGIGVEWNFISLRRLNFFLGAKNMLGKGYAHVGYGRRPDIRYGNYADWNFDGFGAGMEAQAGAHFFAASNLYFGISAAYRIVRTETMQSMADGAPWRRPPEDPHGINLDFSGVTLQAQTGVEF